MADKKRPKRSTTQQIINGLNKGLVSDVVGAPVDIATMLLNAPGQVYGAVTGKGAPYEIKNPVGGSDWVTGLLEDAGMAYNDGEDTSLLEDAVRLGSGIVGPAGMIKGAQAAPKVIQKAAENAAKPRQLHSQKGVFLVADQVKGNKTKIAAAEKLEKKGLPPEEVWKQTGLWRGPEGKWRLEVPDNKMLTRDVAADKARGAAIEVDRRKAVGQDVVRGLKERIQKGEIDTETAVAELEPYQRDVDLARAEQTKYNDARTMLRSGDNPYGVPLHQAVQHDELFSRVPDLRSYNLRTRFGQTTNPDEWGGYNQAVGRGSGVIEARGYNPYDTRAILAHELQHQIQSQHGLPLGGSPTMFSPSNEAFRLKARELGYPVEDYGPGKGGFEIYRRLAGEAEARAVQKRANMGDAELAETFPLRSYDLPIQELILDPRAAGLLDDGADTTARATEVIPKNLQGPSLEGLPANVIVDGSEEIYGGFRPAQEAAERYMRDAGLSYDPPRAYVPVDVDRARRIAAEYDKMPHAPNDPLVKQAYERLAEETMGQYEAARRAGVKFNFMPESGDPYGNPRNAIKDIYQNNHTYVFPTESGFGTLGADVSGNPLLAKTGEKWGGKPVLVNDAFRAVHDYFGHAKEGVGFRAGGEENAWQSHASMFSPLARRALTTETRGQNSWLNYGPYGDRNRTADTANTIFADQKTGLLPEWVSTEGYGGLALPKYLLDY